MFLIRKKKRTAAQDHFRYWTIVGAVGHKTHQTHACNSLNTQKNIFFFFFLFFTRKYAPADVCVPGGALATCPLTSKAGRDVTDAKAAAACAEAVAELDAVEEACVALL